MTKTFFELIQVAIGTRICLSQTPSADEWGELYAMAKKQSLVGVCFAGVQRLYNDNVNENPSNPLNPSNPSNLPEMDYLQWMGMAAKIQQRNEVVDQQCKELWNVLHEAGLDAAVMKGQAIGCYYGELSQLRQSGDIDVWVKGGFDTVNEYIQSTVPSDDIAYHRFHYNVYSDTEVELHHRPTLMRNLFDNKKLQTWCDGVTPDEFIVNRKGFAMPPARFDRIFILTHIYAHFLFSGIGLRQIMDYYFLLKNTSASEDEEMLLKQFRLTRFAGAMMWLLKEKFGLEDDKLICEPIEDEGRYFLREVEYSGNFGHSDERFRGFSTLRKMTQRGAHLLWHYPSEVIWTPIWLVYHKFWKREHRNKVYNVRKKFA